MTVAHCLPTGSSRDRATTAQCRPWCAEDSNGKGEQGHSGIDEVLDGVARDRLFCRRHHRRWKTTLSCSSCCGVEAGEPPCLSPRETKDERAAVAKSHAGRSTTSRYSYAIGARGDDEHDLHPPMSAETMRTCSRDRARRPRPCPSTRSRLRCSQSALGTGDRSWPHSTAPDGKTLLMLDDRTPAAGRQLQHRARRVTIDHLRRSTAATVVASREKIVA